MIRTEVKISNFNEKEIFSLPLPKTKEEKAENSYRMGLWHLPPSSIKGLPTDKNV